MADFTTLLNQTTTHQSSTLTDTLRKHAKDLTDQDMEVLVAGLREQRQRWNIAQASGSKERVTSKSVQVPPTQVSLSGFAIKKPTI